MAKLLEKKLELTFHKKIHPHAPFGGAGYKTHMCDTGVFSHKDLETGECPQ